MTRIVGGLLSGRRLAVPTSARPTTDRVRESVFSSLGHHVAWDECSVLDLYAGSGALGLEALSRGAQRAVFVERDRAAARMLRDNVKALDVENCCTIVQADAGTWRPAPGERYELVLVDPPYDVPAPTIIGVLERLATGGLAPDALVVVERPLRDPQSPLPTGWAGWQRRYGDTAVWYGHAQVPTDGSEET